MTELADDEVDVTALDIDELGITILLPTGWDATLDPEAETLTVVADDDRFADDDYYPSITIERRLALIDTDLAEAAEASLAEMDATYDDFALQWSEMDDSGERLMRSYEFDVPELTRRVRQVQGLVATDGFLIVNCTAPLSSADELEPLWRMVIATLDEY